MMTHLKVEAQKLQVKSSVASWAKMCCECRTLFVVISKLKLSRTV